MSSVAGLNAAHSEATYVAARVSVDDTERRSSYFSKGDGRGSLAALLLQDEEVATGGNPSRSHSRSKSRNSHDRSTNSVHNDIIKDVIQEEGEEDDDRVEVVEFSGASPRKSEDANIDPEEAGKPFRKLLFFLL